MVTLLVNKYFYEAEQQSHFYLHCVIVIHIFQEMQHIVLARGCCLNTQQKHYYENITDFHLYPMKSTYDTRLLTLGEYFGCSHLKIACMLASR